MRTLDELTWRILRRLVENQMRHSQMIGQPTFLGEILEANRTFVLFHATWTRRFCVFLVVCRQDDVKAVFAPIRHFSFFRKIGCTRARRGRHAPRCWRYLYCWWDEFFWQRFRQQLSQQTRWTWKQRFLLAKNENTSKANLCQ